MSSDNNEKNNINGGEQDIDSIPLYKKKSAWIGLFFILIILSGGVYWFLGSLGTITSDDAYIDGNKLNISSKVLGRVIKLYVDERDSVKSGQLIAELDTTDLIAKLNQAKAVLNNVQYSINLARVNVEKAQIDFDRAKGQLTDNVIPKAEFDNSQKKLEAAQAEFKIAESRITTAQMDIKVIQSNLDNTKLYSTIDGVVAKKWILEGDVIQPGQPVFTVYDLKNIWVTAQLEETRVGMLKLDDNVEIDVDSYPDLKFTGKIFQVGTNTASQFSLIPPSNASGNFTKVTQRIPVKISIKPVNEKTPLMFGLLPGMSVEIKIKVKDNG